MAKKNICFLASNANRTVKLAKMAKISQVWHLCLLSLTATKTTQKALSRLERWFEHW